jgi:hypothetical protein
LVEPKELDRLLDARAMTEPDGVASKPRKSKKRLGKR